MAQEKKGVVTLGRTRCENGGTADSTDRSGEPSSAGRNKSARSSVRSPNPDLKDLIEKIQKENLG